MAIMRWDPFSELNSLHEQVNSLFNESFGDNRHTGLVMPTTDVYSDDKQLTIEAHLPNFKEDEINLQLNEGQLEIKAEHKEKEEDKDRKYLLRESVSRYYRRFALPKNSDGDNVQANFENGILKVVIPFKELPQPKNISISAKAKSSEK